jgi:CheY-like chemotaxis protein
MLKVIIAEDDFFQAEMIDVLLSANGYEVCGKASTVKDALELGESHKPDLAFVDVWLAEGGHGREIGARLKREGGTGILLATGTNGKLGALGLSGADGHAFLGKPFSPADLLHALKIAEQMIRTGIAPEPYPDGFHVLESSPTPDMEPS